MDFYGAVGIQKVDNQRDRINYVVAVKKDIKQED
jgi:hypothetical protein